MLNLPFLTLASALSMLATVPGVPGAEPEPAPISMPMGVHLALRGITGEIVPSKCHVLQAPLSLRVGRRSRRP